MTERLSAKQFQQLTKRSNKYGAKRIHVDGHTFPSKKEANRYCELKRLQDAGQIESLELQPVFPLEIHGVCRVKTATGRTMRFTADFSYRQNGKRIVEDTKGYRTRDYIVRKAVAEAFHNIRVVEV